MSSSSGSAPLVGERVANAGIPAGASLDQLLTAALSALDGGRWYKCRKCYWIWRQLKTKRYREALRFGARGNWRGRVKPRLCPNCFQDWEKPYQRKRRAVGGPKLRHSRDLLVRRVRLALLEHSIRMKEEGEQAIWERTKELMRRLG